MVISYIEDTEDGRKLKEYLESFDDLEMYCAAEFGIGLNTISKCRGASYIEDRSLLLAHSILVLVEILL